jgi:dihydroneopterin aldolase
MDTITISELEVHYRIGVPDDERSKPQRLLITVEIELDFTNAAKTDELSRTIDYYAITRRLLRFGDDRSWRLLETLAVDVAQMILAEYSPARVSVEVRKFIIPETRHVSVRISRSRS